MALTRLRFGLTPLLRGAAGTRAQVAAAAMGAGALMALTGGLAAPAILAGAAALAPAAVRTPSRSDKLACFRRKPLMPRLGR